MLVLVPLALLLAASAALAPSHAQVALQFPNGTVLVSPGAYSPQLGSAPDFGTVGGVAWFAGTVCTPWNATAALPSPWLPESTVVFYDDNDFCDGGVSLQLLRDVGAVMAVALYEFSQPPSDPNDAPPRYAVYPGPRTLFTSRVHGADSQRFGWALQAAAASQQTIFANVTFSADPWVAMERGPVYLVLYQIPQILTFWLLVPLLTISALYAFERGARTTQAGSRRALRTSLPYVCMCFGLTVAVLKVVEYSSGTFARDYAQTWTPEVRRIHLELASNGTDTSEQQELPQTAYVCEEVVLLTLMLLLLLHWRQILQQTRRGAVGNRLDNKSLGVLLAVSGALAVWLVVLHSLVTYHVPGWQRLSTLQFVLPGIVIVVECACCLVWGGRILIALLGLRMSKSNSAQSNDGNNAAAEADRERRRVTVSKAVPLTRLVVIAGILLAASGLTSLIFPYTDAFQEPGPYPVFLIVTGAAECTITLLIIDVLSPVSQARRQKNLEKSASSGKRVAQDTLSAPAPGGGLGTSTLASPGSRWAGFGSSLRGLVSSAVPSSVLEAPPATVAGGGRGAPRVGPVSSHVPAAYMADVGGSIVGGGGSSVVPEESAATSTG